MRDELARRGTPFRSIGRRDGEAQPRYVAHTHIGSILAQYDGAQWTLFLSPPGARRYASYPDWAELMYGRAPGGYQSSETASTVWIEKLLKEDEPPLIDVKELDKIIQARHEAPEPSKTWVILAWLMVAAVFLVLGYFVITTHMAVINASFATLVAALVMRWKMSRYRKSGARRSKGST